MARIVQTVAWNSCGLTSFCCCCRNRQAKHRGTSPHKRTLPLWLRYVFIFIYCFWTVNKGDMVLLRCTAGGYPAPNITWTRLSDNNVVTFPLTFTGKQDGVYRCTASNGFGSPVIRDITIALPSKSL